MILGFLFGWLFILVYIICFLVLSVELVYYAATNSSQEFSLDSSIITRVCESIRLRLMPNLIEDGYFIVSRRSFMFLFITLVYVCRPFHCAFNSVYKLCKLIMT